jgi:hypothetical protein
MQPESDKEEAMKIRCGRDIRLLPVELVRGLVKQFCAVLVTIACLVGFSLGAMAAELKWQHTHHLLKADTTEVGDAPGHVIGSAKASGLGFFGEGAVATVDLAATIDYRNGAGETEGYIGYTFEDGSTFFLKYSAVTTPDPVGKASSIKGRFAFTQGTGHFSGLTGGGTFTGKRLSPFGGGSEVYLVFSGTYSQ